MDILILALPYIIARYPFLDFPGVQRQVAIMLLRLGILVTHVPTISATAYVLPAAVSSVQLALE